MSVLTSLLARDLVVPLRTIEEALQKQVLSGGDIGSILLDQDALPENTLAAYCAARHRLLPATRDEVMRVSRDVIRLVPREVAEKHRFVPIQVDGSGLVVASASPLDVATAESVGYLLGHTLVCRIVCEIRVAAALMHHYGLEAGPREVRLIDRLRQRDAGPVPYVAPPQDAMTSATSSGPSLRRLVNWLDDDEEDDASSPTDDAVQPPPSRAPMRFARPRVTDPMGIPRSSLEPSAAPRPSRRPPSIVPASTPPDEPVVSVLPAPAVLHAPAVLPALDSEPPAAEPPTAATRGEDPDAAVDPRTRLAAMPPPPAPTEARALEAPPSLDALAGALPAPSLAPAPAWGAATPRLSSAAPRGRGMATTAGAAAAMDAAASRDEIVGIYAEFAASYFEYTAVFAVQSERAEGRLAHGPGTPTEPFRAVSLSLRDGGTLAEVRAAVQARIGPLTSSDADARLARALGRPLGATVALIPVAIRGRTVLLLYGDRGAERFTLHEVRDLLALTPRVAQALEALILRRKSEPASARGESVRAEPTAPSISPLLASLPPAAAVPSRPASVPPPRPASVPPARPASAPPPRVDAAGVLTDSLHTALGVPRAAPPPPVADVDLPTASEPPPVARASTPPGPASSPPARGSSASSASSRPAPELIVERASLDDLDGLADVELEPPRLGSSPDEDPMPLVTRAVHRPSAAPASSLTYSHKNAAVEVFQPRRRTSSTPPARPEESAPEASLGPDTPVTRERIDVPARGVTATSPATPRRVGPSQPTMGDPASSVVIDMGVDVNEAVATLADTDVGMPPSALDPVMSLGDAALPALAQAFPGRLWIERARRGDRFPRGRDVSAIGRALVAFGPRAAPYVEVLLLDRAAERRFFAVLVAGDLAHPSSIPGLVDATVDDDGDVRTAALEVLPALRAHRREWDGALVDLRVSAKPVTRDPVRRLRAVEALGALHEETALRILVDALDDADRAIAGAAHAALVELTCEDLGPRTIDWAEWVATHGDKTRVEWLIEALGHRDRAMHARAGESLKALTQQYLGYHPDASADDRREIQRKYRGWWEREGRYRFLA